MNQALDSELKNWMVKKAETIADKASEKRGQKAQLRNLMQVAQVESEVAVLRNFLQYQAGRQATRSFWGPIYEDVNAALEEIARRLGSASEAERRQAIQRFFGYMVRRYVFKTELRGGGGRGSQGPRAPGHGGGPKHGGRPGPGRPYNRGGRR